MFPIFCGYNWITYTQPDGSVRQYTFREGNTTHSGEAHGGLVRLTNATHAVLG